MSEFNPELVPNYDLESEFKPYPTINAGIYTANVTEVKHNAKDNTIDWKFVLVENGGYCSDDETPVDGRPVVYRNWLPSAGDENVLTSSGKMTKRQAKINMLVDFAKKSGFDMNFNALNEALSSGSWIGTTVKLAIGQREYNGKIFDDVKNVHKIEG